MRALQTLNAYSGDYGICLARKFIEDKTNERPEAREVPKLIDLNATVVTADAMNCQKEPKSYNWEKFNEMLKINPLNCPKI